MRKPKGLSMCALFLAGMLALTFGVTPVGASVGTVYIRPDGSVDPPEAPIRRVGDVYTLTGDINGSIVVERDNIVLDGGGYAVQGPGRTGRGIDLTSRSNVTVKDTTVIGFYHGIYLNGSRRNTVSGNNATWNVGYGIYLDHSGNSTVSANDATLNAEGGIYLGYSSHCTVTGNTANNNGPAWPQWNHFGGIYLDHSGNCTVSGNIAIDNNADGIYLDHSDNCTVSGNTLRNRAGGMGLHSSNYCTVSTNSVTKNMLWGIELHSSNYCTVLGNDASKNDHYGIILMASSNNTILANNVNDNGLGIYLDRSSNNSIHHNNFNNTNQVLTSESINTWDDGYPSGGNYWSNYNGTDLYGGPGQNETGGDGIGDSPYVINENNQDNYPLMNPWGPKEGPKIPFWTRWWLWAIVAVVIVASAGAVYFLKKRKPLTPTATNVDVNAPPLVGDHRPFPY